MQKFGACADLAQALFFSCVAGCVSPKGDRMQSEIRPATRCRGTRQWREDDLCRRMGLNILRLLGYGCYDGYSAKIHGIKNLDILLGLR